jgi:hypothetical protein
MIPIPGLIKTASNVGYANLMLVMPISGELVTNQSAVKTECGEDGVRLL